MSTTVETHFDAPGEEAYLDDAWALKEQIRKDEGILKQQWHFFSNSYRAAAVYLLCLCDELVGFAAVRSDGYILFLAVAPEHRGRGFGRRLVEHVARDYDTVTCHARASNEPALGFYEAIGFETTRRIDDYYADGGDAYHLRLGSNSLADRLTDLFDS